MYKYNYEQYFLDDHLRSVLCVLDPRHVSGASGKAPISRHSDTCTCSSVFATTPAMTCDLLLLRVGRSLVNVRVRLVKNAHLYSECTFY